MPLRLGILGAARSVPMIIVKPIKRNADLAGKIEVVAIASRDASKATAFAKEYDIPRSYGSYPELLADPGIDAVYISLPNAFHCEWTVRALQAGKHVLCGKPLTCNAREAVVIQRAAEDAGKVCLEAFHALRHPMCQRVREMIKDGKIGGVRTVDVKYLVNLEGYDGRIRSNMHTPTPMAEDYRMRSEMGGGVTMDLGCYCIAIIRAITGEDPEDYEVVSAMAQRWKDDDNIDAAMTCQLKLPNGADAHFECSFVAQTYAQPIMLKISGTHGDINVEGFFSSHKANKIVLEQWDDSGIISTESVATSQTRDSFYYQLLDFSNEVAFQAGKVSAGLPWSYTKNDEHTPAKSVKNMAVIDDIYRAAGMQIRQTRHPPPAPYDVIGLSKL
jgi:predicted dehydrogenase